MRVRQRKKAIGARTGLIFLGEDGRGNTKEDVRQLADTMQDQDIRQVHPARTRDERIACGTIILSEVGNREFPQKKSNGSLCGKFFIFFKWISFPTVQLTNHSTGTGHN